MQHSSKQLFFVVGHVLRVQSGSLKPILLDCNFMRRFWNSSIPDPSTYYPAKEKPALVFILNKLDDGSRLFLFIRL